MNFALAIFILLTLIFGVLAYMAWKGKVVKIPWRSRKKALTTAEQNERLYANIATCMAFGSCSIVEIMKNDPETVKAYDPIEWLAMVVIYGVFILGQRLNAIKAFRSDPNVRNKNPDTEPPGKPEPTQYAKPTPTPIDPGSGSNPIVPPGPIGGV